MVLCATFRHWRAEELDDVDGGFADGPIARREGRVGLKIDAASSNGEVRVRSRWSPWRAAKWGAVFGILFAVSTLILREGSPSWLLAQIIVPALLFPLGAAIRNLAVRAAGFARSKALNRKYQGHPRLQPFGCASARRESMARWCRPGICQRLTLSFGFSQGL